MRYIYIYIFIYIYSFAHSECSHSDYDNYINTVQIVYNTINVDRPYYTESQFHFNFCEIKSMSSVVDNFTDGVSVELKLHIMI